MSNLKSIIPDSFMINKTTLVVADHTDTIMATIVHPHHDFISVVFWFQQQPTVTPAAIITLPAYSI
jgi:hypothetical protein